jgi:putative transcriptional regulator
MSTGSWLSVARTASLNRDCRSSSKNVRQFVMALNALARARFCIGIVLATLPVCSVRAQTSLPLVRQRYQYEGLAPGIFLLAPPEAIDPHFAAAVVLLLSYDANGAVGLVVNWPTAIPIGRVLENVKPAKRIADPAYSGGPMEQDVVFALYRSAKTSGKAAPLFGDVYLASTKPALEHVLSRKPTARTLRIYLGYTGWGPGQLDHEMDLGVWRILPADAQSIFDADPSSVWPRLIQRTEMRLALNSRR